MSTASSGSLPLKVAVLVYLYDERDRLLMLHRRKSPNSGMHSPIGGKVEVSRGESPHECALREAQEEAGVTLDYSDIRLCGIVSERAYEGENHWLIFLFESVRPIGVESVGPMEIDEGTLAWVPVTQVEQLSLPEADRKIMWPSARAHRGGFFMLQIDCSVKPTDYRLVESSIKAHQPGSHHALPK